MYIDYYKALGVNKTATQSEIKSAYRKLARKFHPDLNPDDRDAKKNFQLINEANEVLSDPEKRKKYDQYGENWKHAEEYQEAEKQQQRSSGRSRSGWQESSSFGGSDEFSDFFESLFGNMGGRRQRSRAGFRGEDYTAELNLTLREAAVTRRQELTVNGKKIRITIPAGVDNGQTIRIAGHGGPGANGGPSGDLYIKFSITDDPVFKRLGNDLYMNAEIDLYTAMLGGEIILETLDGKIKTRIKPETPNGTRIKLKGKGFPVYKKTTESGDLYVTLSVRLPASLSARERELFSELARINRESRK